ncbi:MAG: peptide chain release factor-like protein, partial [Gemmatimonadaceae bacterium]
DQRSQIQNKAKAMEVLRSRLLDLRVAQQEAERSRLRRSAVSTGDRSAKIRTYNFPQSRITDHRINFTTHDLHGVLEGKMNELVEALKVADLEERLASAQGG